MFPTFDFFWVRRTRGILNEKNCFQLIECSQKVSAPHPSFPLVSFCYRELIIHISQCLLFPVFLCPARAMRTSLLAFNHEKEPGRVLRGNIYESVSLPLTVPPKDCHLWDFHHPVSPHSAIRSLSKLPFNYSYQFGGPVTSNRSKQIMALTLDSLASADCRMGPRKHSSLMSAKKVIDFQFFSFFCLFVCFKDVIDYSSSLHIRAEI